ncbi:MAG TPA: hypothetical protein VFZ29_00085 [Solirubrobacterales bacterium]
MAFTDVMIMHVNWMTFGSALRAGSQICIGYSPGLAISTSRPLDIYFSKTAIQVSDITAVIFANFFAPLAKEEEDACPHYPVSRREKVQREHAGTGLSFEAGAVCLYALCNEVAAMAHPMHTRSPKAVRPLEREEIEHLKARRRQLLETLDLAFSPAVIARALVQVGLVPQDLADATGAHVRTVSAWLDESKPEPKKREHQERLRELKRVTRFIVDDGTICLQEVDWLREPHARVDLQTPLQLIRKGEWREAGQLYCDDVAIEIPSIFLPMKVESEERAGYRKLEAR